MIKAIIIVSALGLFCAVMLSVVSKLMAVKVDEREAAVREALPGANCGACGYAGCDQYAKALVEGGVKPNLCIPGGNDAAKLISEIMGLPFEAAAQRKARVHCSGTPDNAPDCMEYVGPASCVAAKSFYSGKKACSHGCLGFGDCVKACSFGAIEIKDGIAVVNEELCSACGACAKACPSGCIEVGPVGRVFVSCNSTDKGAVTRKVCKVGCIGCMKCKKVCEFDAITITDNLAHIDPEKCQNCGKCVAECPVHAIKTHC